MHKLLIIGCGSIGQRHLKNASQHAQAAVFDLNHLLAKQVAASTQTQYFENLNAAWAWKPDGVVVATPHASHLAVAQAAIAEGAHVMIEKPISNHFMHVDELIQQGQQASKKIFVVCNMRFHSAVALLKRELDSIGTPYFARAYYGHYLPNMRPNGDYRTLYAARKNSGGGVILDAIHEVDYLGWLFGEVAAVSCEAVKRSQLDIDVEDYAAITLRHKNGVRAEIHLDYLQHCKRRGCEITGELGTLIWSSEGKQPEVCRVRRFLKKTGQWETIYFCDNEDTNQPYELLMNQFIKAIGQEVNTLADAKEGAAALRVSLAALESAQRQSTVFILNAGDF